MEESWFVSQDKKTKVENCKFKECSLNGAHFGKAPNQTTVSAEIVNTQFSGGSLEGATMAGCILSNLTFDGKINISKLNLSGAILGATGAPVRFTSVSGLEKTTISANTKLIDVAPAEAKQKLQALLKALHATK